MMMMKVSKMKDHQYHQDSLVFSWTKPSSTFSPNLGVQSTTKAALICITISTNEDEGNRKMGRFTHERARVWKGSELLVAPR